MWSEKWDRHFLAVAQQCSTMSKDPSTKVGAVIVRPDKTICSTGYNGFPMGMKDDADLYEDREQKYDRVIHGEMNALLFAREPVRGYTIYLWPFLSCSRCSAHIIQAGIKRVVTEVTPQHIAMRWEDSLRKSMMYYKEAGVEVTTYL